MNTNNGPVVLTGACGAIGTVLRKHFIETARAARFSDIRVDEGDLDVPVIRGDLGDPAFCDGLLESAGAVVHMAGIPVERPIDELLRHNYLALYHLYEAARRHQVARVVFASSNHATGMYAPSLHLDPSMQVNPDSQYGLSKIWGEGLARLYWEKHGIETVCLRIGSFQPRPVSVRHLSTWLSHADTCRLVDAALDTPGVGFDILYGVSANTRSWWDNSRARTAYHPEDNAETFAEHILRDAPPVDPLESRFQGADFAAAEFSRPLSAGDVGH